MRLKRKPPKNRTFEQLRNHYLAEKSIADRLKNADREERKLIYATMYDEVFAKVPDHPRLNRREDKEATLKANKKKLGIVGSFLDKTKVFVEFAPGDCLFSFEVAKHVKKAYGIDISDQCNKKDDTPANFELIIYDGYALNEIKKNSIDIMFSDQLIEHLHPEETMAHFKIAQRILKQGGGYIFRTPHLFMGPADISKYFSDTPEGFHLKEWTYTELYSMFKKLDYSEIKLYMYTKGHLIKLPYTYYKITEKLLFYLPRKLRRFFAKYLIKSICCMVVK